jgi:hypothetical protein
MLVFVPCTGGYGCLDAVHQFSALLSAVVKKGENRAARITDRQVIRTLSEKEAPGYTERIFW